MHGRHGSRRSAVAPRTLSRKPVRLLARSSGTGSGLDARRRRVQASRRWDRSWSMHGQRLARAKRIAGAVVERLDEQDQVALVVSTATSRQRRGWRR